MARLDVDRYQNFGSKWGVSAFPTIMLFRDGIPIGAHVGLVGPQGQETSTLVQWATKPPADFTQGVPMQATLAAGGKVLRPEERNLMVKDLERMEEELVDELQRVRVMKALLSR